MAATAKGQKKDRSGGHRRELVSVASEFAVVDFHRRAEGAQGRSRSPVQVVNHGQTNAGEQRDEDGVDARPSPGDGAIYPAQNMAERSHGEE